MSTVKLRDGSKRKKTKGTGFAWRNKNKKSGRGQRVEEKSARKKSLAKAECLIATKWVVNFVIGSSGRRHLPMLTSNSCVATFILLCETIPMWIVGLGLRATYLQIMKRYEPLQVPIWFEADMFTPLRLVTTLF